MSAGRRAAGTAAALLALAAAPSLACALVFSEHRSGSERLRWPLPGGPTPFSILFTHSVLGTPVADRYEWRATSSGWQAHLVEERFEGQGYGLPHAAGPGQRIVGEGAVTRLELDRPVHPLVVRPLPAQRMRVVVGPSDETTAVVLADLSQAAIELSLSGCARP